MPRGRERAKGAGDPAPMVLQEDDEAPGEATAPVDDEDLDDIEGAIAQIDDDEATVLIKRRDPEDPSVWTYLTQLPARAFSLEKIKVEYGGGEYKALTLDRHRRFVKGVPRLFRIDRAFKPRPVVPPPTNGDGGGAARSPEVVALAAKVDALTAAVQAQNSSRETLDYALKIATVMSGGAGKGLGADAVLGVLEKGLALRDRFAGSAEDRGDGEREERGDAFDVALRELVKPVAKLLESEVERRAKAKPGAGDAQPARLPAGEGDPMPATAPQWLVRIRPFIPQLVGLAREGADPELYARVVVDLMDRKLSAAEVGAIEEAAQQDGFVESLMAGLPPSTAPFTAWFQRLAVALRAELQPDVGVGDPAAG